MFDDPAVNPEQGLRGTCLTCHEGYDTNQKSLEMMMDLVECVDCHMPPMARSAVGDAAAFTADQPSHLFGINTEQGLPQFYTEGGQQWSQPYITLDYACNHCHGNGQSVQTPAALEAMATGYHQ
jgi:hypothetical protein